MEEKNKLTNLTEEIQKLSEAKDILDYKIHLLKQKTLIQKYIELSEKDNSISQSLIVKRNELIKYKQKICKHPLWYRVDYSNCGYEGRSYLLCECLECGKREEGTKGDFQNVVVGNYDEIKNEYDNIKIEVTPEVKAKELLKKHEMVIRQ